MILYLKSYNTYFNDIPDDQLVNFVSEFEHLYLDKDDVYNIVDDEQAPFIWLFSGFVHIRTKLSLTIKIESGQLSDLNSIPYIQSIVAKESSMLYILKRNIEFHLPGYRDGIMLMKDIIL